MKSALESIRQGPRLSNEVFPNDDMLLQNEAVEKGTITIKIRDSGCRFEYSKDVEVAQFVSIKFL